MLGNLDDNVTQRWHRANEIYIRHQSIENATNTPLPPSLLVQNCEDVDGVKIALETIPSGLTRENEYKADFVTSLVTRDENALFSGRTNIQDGGRFCTAIGRNWRRFFRRKSLQTNILLSWSGRSYITGINELRAVYFGCECGCQLRVKYLREGTLAIVLLD